MILTVTKMTFQKLKPRFINYREYKHFNSERFRDDLLSEISNSYLEFDITVLMNFQYVPINIRSAYAAEEEVCDRESCATYE